MGTKTGDQVDLAIEDGVLAIKALHADPRAGWAADAREIAAAGDDHGDLGEFSNDGGDVWRVALDPTLGIDIS